MHSLKEGSEQRWKNATYVEVGSGFCGKWDIPQRWLQIHYFEALNVLFRIENFLRVITFIVLKSEFNEKWSEQTVWQERPGSDADSQITIKKVALQRIAQAQKFGYLGNATSCPIMHLTTGELVRIITSEVYWPHFAKFFRGTKDNIKNKLDEVTAIRNTLAHFRPVSEGSVQLVKQYADIVLANAEHELLQALNQNDNVPSNTTEQWYLELRKLATDSCTFSFFQSSDGKWIKIRLQHRCSVLAPSEEDAKIELQLTGHTKYYLANLIVPAALRKFEALARFSILVSEFTPYNLRYGGMPPKILKDIEFVFNRTTLQANHTQIRASLDDLLRQIEDETELMKSDHLARGELVAAYRKIAKKSSDGKSWLLGGDILQGMVGESDPPEYWANFLRRIDVDFLGGTRYYPWMEEEVSYEERLPETDDDLPF